MSDPADDFKQHRPNAASLLESIIIWPYRRRLRRSERERLADFLFDPSSVSVRLPDVYRLLTVADRAKQDAAVRARLEQDPRHATNALGTLCFVALSSFIVDDVLVHQPGVAEMAFWWARTEGPSDSDMRGPLEWVQLASWYGSDFTERQRIVAADPMAQFADVEISQREPDLWRLRLTLTEEIVEAEVRTSGDRIKRNAPEPGFTTVVLSSEGAGQFMVFTYFGHHSRLAKGTWQARGPASSAKSFRSPVCSAQYSRMAGRGCRGFIGSRCAGSELTLSPVGIPLCAVLFCRLRDLHDLRQSPSGE